MQVPTQGRGDQAACGGRKLASASANIEQIIPMGDSPLLMPYVSTRFLVRALDGTVSRVGQSPDIVLGDIL
jgi:hypothetical protein